MLECIVHWKVTYTVIITLENVAFSMKRRVFMGLGAASIGAGALYRTGAFSSVSAGRGVAVNAADDSSALFGIKNADDPDSPPEFTNRATSQMEVEFDPEENSVTLNGEDPTEFDLTLDPSESKSVEIDSDTAGLTTIVITVTVQSGGTIELERQFGVPQSEQISLTPNVDNAGNSGKVSFEVENDGDIDVEVVSVVVNYATVNNNADPVRITDALVDETGGNDAPGPIDVLNRDLNDLDLEDFVSFSDPIPLNVGSTNEFEADNLEDEDGGNARYNNGGTLDITFKLSDGSKALLEMEI